MKRLTMMMCGLALLWAGSLNAQQTNVQRVVHIKLTDGTVLEGPLVSENDQQVVIFEERAGGTIQQNRVIVRKDIAEITELSAEERRQRALQIADREVQRYQLNPAGSYQASYYTQVIERVFRPFVQNFPDSPNVADINTRIDAWTEELNRVRGGEVKYQGVWMSAAAATKLAGQQQGDQLMQQARAFISQRQYAKAINRLDQLKTPEARNLTGETYRQWVQALESEQQQATQQVQAAQDKANRAAPASSGGGRQPRAVLGAVRDAASGPDYQALGNQQGGDVIANNKAKAAASAAAQELSRAQAQLTNVESELSRVRALATAAGALQTAAGAPGAGGTNAAGAQGAALPAYVAVSADKEDWSNPSVLQNMWRFFQHYWMAGAVVVVLGGWWLTRKMSK